MRADFRNRRRVRNRGLEQNLIKWVQVGALAKSSEDFAALVKLLDSLGLRKGQEGENDACKFAEFRPARLSVDVIHRKKSWDDADLSLMVTDPDTALEIVQRQGIKVVHEHSGPEPQHLVQNFRLTLPGGTRVLIFGSRVLDNAADTDHLALEGNLHAAGKAFAIVTSRFNSFITERLVAGALDGLTRCGAELGKDITLVRVPGAFEIPSAARTLAQTKKYDAIICIGCLLRGDTAHYDVIVNEVARGIGQSAQETGVPHAFGVLTCETLEQAIDRAGLKMGNKGFEAALAAVEMANLKLAISRQPSAVRKSKPPRAPKKRSRK
jgi:6,7-dimethyl-8-ribityllumazine synthase